jgi:hypothetical protein
MKKMIVLALFISVSFISCKNEKPNQEEQPANQTAEVAKIPSDTLIVDISTSTLKWKGSKPTGSHDGIVGVKSGNLEVNNGELLGGTVVFDMTTITVLDIPAADENNAKLLNHLKSPDFFDVAAYPTSQFVITGIIPGGTTIVKGNLTIKDVTKSIEFPATVEKTENGVQLKAEPFKVDRTEFGIEYKSQKFFDNLKDKFIDDDFEISFVLNASK